MVAMWSPASAIAWTILGSCHMRKARLEYRLRELTLRNVEAHQGSAQATCGRMGAQVDGNGVERRG
jgi:hypothetical protein